MSFPSTDLDIIVEAYLGADPTADPDTWPTATDLSSRLMRRPITVRRGRGKNQKTLQSGSCTFWLENTDGALTPLLATSTYFPDWDLGVPMRVSVDNVGPNPPYVRFAGFVADCKAVMVPGVGGINISAVQVTLGGVWRRLSQGAAAKAPMERSIMANPPDYYWPMEDAQGSTQIASGLPGGKPLLPYDSTVVFEFLAGSGGSDGWLNLIGDAAFVASTTVSITPSDGFQVEFAGMSDQVTGLVAIYATADGDSFVVSAGTNDGEPHYRTASIVQSGADVVGTFYIDGVFSSTSTKVSTTLLANPVVEVFKGGFTTGVVQVSHLSVRRGVSSSASRGGSADAFAGEQAHTRVARICLEEGIPFSGNATLSNECGPQPVGDVTEVLQDAEEVDHGMIVEDFAWGLNYRASSQRENLSPAITIDLATYRTTSGTQADVLTPVRNDQRLRNEWTISRPDGSSATAKDEASQAKRGRYNDADTVNVADDTRILDEAQWRVHEGTFDGLRYDTVPLDIAANL